MSSLVIIVLVLAAGICLVPAILLRRPSYGRAQDYFVASRTTPPGEIRNSSISYALRLAAFGPFLAWGAGGDLWPPIVAAVSSGLGLWLIYRLRRPLLEFLDGALGHDRSITVHGFIADRHGNDPRVRILAASLTLFALCGLIAGEAVAVATLLKPLLTDHPALVYLCVLGLLAWMVPCAALAGTSGVIHSTQLQLGVIFLALFGSTALLLYLHVSALTPMPPHGAFALIFVAVWCVLILWYRRSKYVDANPLRLAPSGRVSRGANLLRKFEQVLNPCISVFAVLVVVVAGMEFYFTGLTAAAGNGFAALRAGTQIPAVALLALVLLPLLYPIADVGTWQRLTAVAKDSPAMPDSRFATLREIFKIYAAESPLLWLFMAMFGAIAVVATQTEAPEGADIMQALIAQLVDDQNEVTVIALPMLLLGVLAIALSTAVALFSAALCTIRYDILPQLQPEPEPGDETLARRRTIIAGGGFFLAIVAAFLASDAWLRINFASSTFLALIFAVCCAQLSFVPLVLGPMLRRANGEFGTMSPRWALAVMAAGVAGAIAAVTASVMTGSEAWLWAAVPACLGASALLTIAARLAPR